MNWTTRFAPLAALTLLGATTTYAQANACSDDDLICIAKGQQFCTEPLLQVGGFGEGDDQLAGADTIEADTAGNMYVVDDVQQLIKVYPVKTKNGATSEIISTADIEAAGLGPLGDIEAVATGSWNASKRNSEFYILDRDSDRDPEIRILFREEAGSDDWIQLEFTDFAERAEDITIDRWGRIVVSERDGVVQVLESDGSALDVTFGVNGTATLGVVEGIEADRLKAVDTDRHGDIYLADKDVGRIIKIDSDGQFVRTFGSQGTGDDQFLEQIEGVSVDRKGIVYGRDESGDRFLAFEPNGDFAAAFGERGSEPNQQENADEFFIDKRRNTIVIADNGNYRASVHRLKKCRKSNIFTEYDFPEFPIVEPLWIAGGTQGSAEGAEFDEPNELGFDADGYLWAGDVFNLRVQIYDDAGTFVGTVGGSGSGDGQFFDAPTGKSGPEAIRVDSQNRMWIVDRGGDRVNVYDGATLSTIGSFTSPDVTFVDPTGLAVDSNDDIYIADQGTDLIHKFSFDGTNLNLEFTFQANEGSESILAKTETLALDEDRDLLFASSEDESRAEVFELSTGTYLDEHVGEQQVGVVPQPGRFADDIEGITTDTVNQYVFMSDERNGRFLVHDLNAADNDDLYDDGEDYGFLGAFGMQGDALGEFLSADGVAVNAAGTLVAIADQGNYRIQVFAIADIKAALDIN